MHFTLSLEVMTATNKTLYSAVVGVVPAAAAAARSEVALPETYRAGGCRSDGELGSAVPGEALPPSQTAAAPGQ